MYIKVKVKPDSKNEELKAISANSFEIKVKEKAERNLANKKICELIKAHFKNPKGGVKIINGHHSNVKLLKVGND